ncbi:MAG: agmatine deiminase family protein [Deltaproteobacteria bacterium]|nr:agmatine deiminase family protein [Deltaproteobacteria bacterium]
MPAEWERHQATWMSWPFDDDMWFGRLKEVRVEYEALVRAIAKYETVHLLLRDGEAWDSATNALRDAAGIKFHPMPLDDVWMRDNGPIFVRRRDPHSLLKDSGYAYVNWGFNAWGDKYESAKDNLVPERLAPTLRLPRFEPGIIMEGGSLDVDGFGTCLTTRQCLLTPTRNPHLSPADIERYLADYLGISRVIWLNEGLEGDHTDGHVDTITRFVAPGVVVTSVTDNKDDPNYPPMLENLEILKAEIDARGIALKVVELPLPKEPIHLEDGTRLPATYANFYFVNSAVLVPQYGDPNDHKALSILQGLLPDRKVIGLSSRSIIVGGGSFHCLTQQQPEVER